MYLRNTNANLRLIKTAYPNLQKGTDLHTLNALLRTKTNLEKIISVFKTESWTEIVKTPRPYSLLIRFQTGAEVKRPRFLENHVATVKCLGGLAVYARLGAPIQTLNLLFPHRLNWRHTDIDDLLKGQGCTLRKLERNLMRCVTTLENKLGNPAEALLLIVASINAKKY